MSIPILLSSTDYNIRSELFSQNEQGLHLDPAISESARTWRRNLLTYSDQFSNAVWLKQTNGTGSVPVVTANTSVAPDGTTTADTIVFDRGAGNTTDDRSVLLQSYSAVTSTVYTGSIYLKAATAGDIGKQLALRVMGTATFQVITLTADWARYSLQETAHLTGTRNIEIMNRGTFSADNTVTALVWGGQVEIGSLTDYQPITDFSTEFKAAFPTHTIYQDSNGVAPVTAPGDLVGLVLDQRQGALTNLGPELVTNGGFDSDTWWVKTAGVTIASGVCQYTSVALNGGVYRTVFLTAGKFYAVDFTVSGFSSGGVRVYSGGNRTGAFSGNGTYRVIVLAGSTDASLIFEATATGTTLALDNISVREVPGNHAYQPTTGAPRPALARVPFGGRRNLLTRTEEFDNAAWVKPAATITANATTAFNGELVADEINEGTTTNFHQVQQLVSLAAGSAHVISCDFKYIDRQYINLAIWSNGGAGLYAAACFDIQNGTVKTSGESGTGFAVGGTSITSLGDGWYRCVVIATVGSVGANTIGFAPSDDGSIGSYGLDSYLGTSKRFYATRIQLETGSSATNYQRVGLTTDVTEAGQPDCWALFFDGSDDFLQTNAIDFAGWTQETRRNLLVEGDQFDATGWTKTNTTITPNAIANPVNGAVDADLMVDTTGTGAHNVTRADFNCVAGQAYTCSCYVKAAGRTVFQMVITSGVVTSGFANFDLQNGVVGSKAVGVTSTYMIDLGNGWYRCVAEFTSASTTTGIINFSTVTTPTSVRAESYTGDGTSGIYIYGGQWEAGTLTDYQRVGTDEMTVIAGVRKLSDAATGIIAELSATISGNNGAFWLVGPTTAAADYGFRSKGTSLADCDLANVYAAPRTDVLAGVADISADSCILRLNGTQLSTVASDQGSGNYGNHILYIGRRAGSSLSFNGLLHHFIARGRSTSGSKLTGAEKLTGKKSGLNI